VKLYLHPASSACRPVMFFAADQGLEIQHELVDILMGDQHKAAFLAINPTGAIPVLEDGAFRLTESSAILKYLADKIGSPAYPRELQARARVNEMMDWFITGFYQSFGFGLCYAQLPGDLFAGYRIEDPAAQATAIAAAKRRTEKYLGALNDHLLGPDRIFLCGEIISIADYLASGVLSVGETIGCTFSKWPNVARWYARMRARPNWQSSNAGLYAFVAAVSGPDYVRV
jgi:glutathione S-transferase